VEIVNYNIELNRIAKRLAESDGRRIARRNALRDLDSLLRRMRRELRKKYPSIGKDGKEIVPTVLRRGERKCPLDGDYVPTPGEFAKHVVRKHQGKCWCGFVPSWKEEMRTLGTSGDSSLKKVMVNYDPSRHGTLGKTANKAASSLRSHFMRVKDQLTSHLVYGSIKQLSAEEAKT